MGFYLNPHNTLFAESLQSQIYVDKTGLIAYTNEVLGTKQKNICISRPRRFGKSMAVEMLAAYYSCGCDSRDLFRGLEIQRDPSFEQHLNRYQVLQWNMQSCLSRSKNAAQAVSFLQNAVLEELREEYGDRISEQENNLITVLEKLNKETQEEFIFIIDEWDCMFRENKNETQAQTAYLDFLRDLLKDKPYVKLAYMTGILPIKKYGTHSALNMFDEFSMTDPDVLARYVGFTEDEVQMLCNRFSMDIEETKNWYDGYVFDGLHIYSPKSVVDAMRKRKFNNYWTKTETYEALQVYISMNYDGLKDAIIRMLCGETYRIDTETFQNDMTSFRTKDDVLTLLVHLGYLAYDSERESVFIPNEEIKAEFARAVRNSGWDEVIGAITVSEKLLNATLAMQNDVVAKIIDAIHMENTSILAYNDENALSCVITLAYYSAKKYYSLLRECQAGKGYADIVFLPRKKYSEKMPFIVELKWDQSVQGAIAQMKQKEYVKALNDYSGDLLLVGINYDKKTKRHECEIEKIRKL
jgi:hypothetical protein